MTDAIEAAAIGRLYEYLTTTPAATGEPLVALVMREIKRLALADSTGSARAPEVEALLRDLVREYFQVATRDAYVAGFRAGGAWAVRMSGALSDPAFRTAIAVLHDLLRPPSPDPNGSGDKPTAARQPAGESVGTPDHGAAASGAADAREAAGADRRDHAPAAGPAAAPHPSAPGVRPPGVALPTHSGPAGPTPSPRYLGPPLFAAQPHRNDGAKPGYAYDHEFCCSLCSRLVWNVRTAGPKVMGNPPRGLRCKACGGAPLRSGEITEVYVGGTRESGRESAA